jgi:hypothetical protein
MSSSGPAPIVDAALVPAVAAAPAIPVAVAAPAIPVVVAAPAAAPRINPALEQGLASVYEKFPDILIPLTVINKRAQAYGEKAINHLIIEIAVFLCIVDVNPKKDYAAEMAQLKKKVGESLKSHPVFNAEDVRLLMSPLSDKQRGINTLLELLEEVPQLALHISDEGLDPALFPGLNKSLLRLNLSILGFHYLRTTPSPQNLQELLLGTRALPTLILFKINIAQGYSVKDYKALDSLLDPLIEQLPHLLVSIEPLNIVYNPDLSEAEIKELLGFCHISVSMISDKIAKLHREIGQSIASRGSDETQGELLKEYTALYPPAAMEKANRDLLDGIASVKAAEHLEQEKLLVKDVIPLVQKYLAGKLFFKFLPNGSKNDSLPVLSVSWPHLRNENVAALAALSIAEQADSEKESKAESKSCDESNSRDCKKQGSAKK